ncbi:hypothetical protein SAMN05192574_12167 [Mucilaginibacter gossypiicola]|uniref:Uncharacterized protein n=1 Tax=Mucilaginibacter gossypiicola TaxID=551995 RepID=A0A1H8V037_9SPHI|nr:hypothetical protein [Mucilaginibacter gossypiicola]SEP08860.1 hypothetical protein SAMN05192574_12167 [Mucilaginibacter gossypiicola]
MASEINIEKKLKHLDFIQLVITRMNVNSFLIKGWSVTLIAALFAFAAKESDKNFIVITYISTFAFWMLDGYYLSQERQYRSLYDKVRNLKEDEIDFDMNAKAFNRGRNSWFKSLFAEIFLYFYGALMIIILAVLIAVKR